MDVDMTERYDTALMGILQNEGEISKFLNVIMGFLFRRTDYYLIMKEKTAKMGFPPGIAKQLLLQAYQQYEKLAQSRESTEHNSQLQGGKTANITATPPVADEIEVVSENTTPISTPSTVTSTVNDDHPAVDPDTTVSSKQSAVDIQQSTNSSESPPKETEKDNDTGERPVYSAYAESYNGAVCENYSWSQSIGDLDVYVTVPEYVHKGKQVRVVMERSSLSVSYLDSSNNTLRPIISGQFSWEVRPDESMWTLVPAKHIHINLEKKQDRWWDSLLIGEPKINIRKIDASRPMSDLGDEEQAKLGELMFNEEQKRKGLPQSHEIKNQEILRNAWNAEGSPFKGQPFDPSVLNASSSDFSTLT